MIDLERCFGCKSCEAACKQEHRLGPGTYRNKVVWLGDASTGAPDFLTLTCQHCERPACLRACPVYPKAITKHPDTGIVEVREALCTGCGECVMACPYSAMGYDAKGHHSVKCDLCPERREEGREPACAEICPGFAISFGERDALLEKAAAEERRCRDHDHFLLGPQTIYLEKIERPNGRVGEGDGGRPAGNLIRPRFADAPDASAVFAEKGPSFPYLRDKKTLKADRVVPGGCNFCFNCCSAKFHFQGERLINVTGNDEDPVLNGKLCPKAQFTLQLHHNEHRLLYPLKRVGRRGEGEFERISWNQALDEIAAKLKTLKERWGAEALALFVGTRTGLITQKGYARLFSQMWGTPNLQGTDPFCAAGKVVSYEVTQGVNGNGNSYTPGDIGSAQMYLYVGDNQAETRPVYFGKVNDWRIKNKAKMVVVDPRYTATASKADKWLGIRPGTDMALGLAMAHHILSTGAHDRRFCEEWVLGWERWREFIFSKGYSPDWAEAVTGVSAEEIRALSEDVAQADGCVIFASRGINQHTNSAQTNRAMMFVAAITGNWGRKGGAYVNMTAGPPIAANAPENRRAQIQKPMVRRSPTGWLNAMRKGKPYPIKGLITCNNPMAQWPGQDEARAAFKALDLIVHIELFSNETSAFADYVLPAAGGIEKGELGRTNDDRRIVWIDKMIDPPGEAKPDGWIWIELGRRLGFGDVMKEEYKEPGRFWDEMCIDNDFLRGVTQKRLHSVPYRWVRFPVSSEDAPEQETLYLEGTTATGQPEGKRFPTPSGRLEFWTEALERKFARVGLSALPEFYADQENFLRLPHLEYERGDDDLEIISPFSKTPTGSRSARIVQPGDGNLGEELRKKGFDTILMTGRPPAPHFHSWTHYFWQAQEMWPDLYCQIHPRKAEHLGIEDGVKLKVETAHGCIEAMAWLNPGIREDAVFIPIGWGERQPYHPWRSVNFLTDVAQRDPVSDQTNLKSLLCRIQKA